MHIRYDPPTEEKEAYQEWENQPDNRIKIEVGYISFVSKSKGRKRKRRILTEVELFRYRAGWHTEKYARLDVCAQEIYNDDLPALMRDIPLFCDSKGG